MNSLSRLKIRYKLPIFLVCFALLASTVLVTVSTINYQRNAWLTVENQFDSIVTDRQATLTALLSSIRADVETLSAIPSIATAAQRISAAWSGVGENPGEAVREMYIAENPNGPSERFLMDRAGKTIPYNIHHAAFHPSFRKLLVAKGYSDAYLINVAGDVMYSVAKQDEYGTNLLSGPFEASNLATLFNQVMEADVGEIVFSDYATYPPGNKTSAAFVGSQIVASSGQVVGVFALQIPEQLVNQIVTQVSGVGETTDIFLVGADNTTRSRSRFEDGHAFLDTLPVLEQIEEAKAEGQSFRTDAIGVNGAHVVTLARDLSGTGVSWTLVVEKERDEVLAPVRHDRMMLIFTSLASAALMTLIGWFYARSFLKPIDGLCASMAAIGHGELDETVPAAARGDEFGDMGRTLVAMQRELKQARLLEDQGREMQAEQTIVVDTISKGLKHLSEGDLTYEIVEPFGEKHERLRLDFNGAVHKLKEVVLEVVETSSSIQSGATEISQASDDLSSRTESQAATLEETAAALDELTASVKSAADGARSVEDIVIQAKGEAEASDVVVQTAVDAMTKIETSSDKISQIISVINDISFQTNLLALNAGVEAARAGEAGRGFAVVASEVRGLAQRSSQAAAEIKTLITESSQHVGEGVDLVGKTGTALRSIVERVTHISSLVSEIAEGAAEQSVGLEEINTGMTQLDQVTQQNAAMVEEATAASHLLRSDSGKLASLVSHFQTGGNHRAPPQQAPVQREVSPPVAVQTVSTPSAHGDDDMEFEPQAPQAPVPMTEGSAARDLWQDF
ncbi:methyl-accepting chemotaxis protein [Tritonibacter horizontis]|uniref:Methyl-accepting chemotaxis protein IV n=1 Tax=Tritonibacter horizontis TaxID=1768241 RepID=A0A132BV06_9RHOB|nr:methyl-accepting chemotaxis protein [Tritonibacter horizontis]KUP91570.1 methyl-accepting chemotaxis protein IV [Tritonibacter horizontis]